MHDRGSPSGPAIEVDIAGLTDLAGQVRAENDRTLRGRVTAVSRDFGSRTAPFGRTFGGGGVYVAKAKYERNMRQAIETLRAYVQAADVLADAAEQVARNYRGADALSAARADEVRTALNAALVKANERAAKTRRQAEAGEPGQAAS